VLLCGGGNSNDRPEKLVPNAAFVLSPSFEKFLRRLLNYAPVIYWTRDDITLYL
jgi:hypothetical protein